MKDLDQRSRSIYWSWSSASKDHFKIIDLDQFEDQDQDHFSSIIKWEAAGYKSFFFNCICKAKVYFAYTYWTMEILNLFAIWDGHFICMLTNVFPMKNYEKWSPKF